MEEQNQLHKEKREQLKSQTWKNNKGQMDENKSEPREQETKDTNKKGWSMNKNRGR